MLATLLIGGLALPVFAAVQVSSGGPLPELPAVSMERLANGIRIVHLPGMDRAGNIYTEIAFGFVLSDGDAASYPHGVRELLASYLSLSVAARSVALAAHLAGGEFELLNVPDRVGIRVRVPSNSLEAVTAQIAMYFSHAIVNFEILEYAGIRKEPEDRGRVPETAEANSEIDAEIEAAMFGGVPDTFAVLDAVEPPGLREVQRYLDNNVGTDRAYVIATNPLPAGAIETLRRVTRRSSTYAPPANRAGDAVEVELRFPSRPDGGVIIATALPDPRFESWFSALAVDRVLRGAAGPDVGFDFQIEAGESIHRIALRVRLPEYSEDLRDDWIRRIQNVMYEGLPEGELDSVKSDVLSQLGERSMLEWFAAHDLWEPLEVGWRMIRELTSDGLRSRALAFARARRVIAIWSPMFSQPELVVEDLGNDAEPEPIFEEPEPLRVPGRLSIPAMARFEATNLLPVELERLDSEITLAGADEHMIFIAGEFGGLLSGGRVVKAGANGVLWAFASEPDEVVFDQLNNVRADRLLFFYPNSAMPSARTRFATWTGGASDFSPSLALGEVATADLPGLLVLKTWLDAKLIEAGWLGMAELRIDGLEGSRLIIDAEPDLEREIRKWIAELGEMGIVDEDFDQVRNAAMGYFDRIRRELQIILWQRAPEGIVQTPASFTLGRLRDVARLYF